MSYNTGFSELSQTLKQGLKPSQSTTRKSPPKTLPKPYSNKKTRKSPPKSRPDWTERSSNMAKLTVSDVVNLDLSRENDRNTIYKLLKLSKAGSRHYINLFEKVINESNGVYTRPIDNIIHNIYINGQNVSEYSEEPIIYEIHTQHQDDIIKLLERLNDKDLVLHIFNDPEFDYTTNDIRHQKGASGMMTSILTSYMYKLYVWLLEKYPDIQVNPEVDLVVLFAQIVNFIQKNKTRNGLQLNIPGTEHEYLLKIINHLRSKLIDKTFMNEEMIHRFFTLQIDYIKHLGTMEFYKKPGGAFNQHKKTNTPIPFITQKQSDKMRFDVFKGLILVGNWEYFPEYANGSNTYSGIDPHTKTYNPELETLMVDIFCKEH